MNSEKAKQIIQAIKSFVKEEPRLSINEVRVIVALERAIARLMRSRELQEHLVFKGGFVLLKSYESLRFTRDGDVLAVSIPKEKLKDLVSRALMPDLGDGMWYGDVQVFELEEQGQYGSYRFDCAFQVGAPNSNKIHKLSRIHIDVAFSDRLPSKPAEKVMPSVLAYESPISWRVYPMEYIVAEKLETLYDRGSANSRAKDVYDIVYLYPRCPDQKRTMDAIRRTFKNRGTALPTSFVREAEQFDQTILKAAWPGIRILDDKLGFDDLWTELMKYLRELDGYFSMA